MTALEDKFTRIAGIATDWHPNKNLVAEMLPTLRNDIGPSAQDTLGNLVDGVTRTFHRHDVGLWFDWREGHVVFDRCVQIATRSISLTDDLDMGSDRYRGFEWFFSFAGIDDDNPMDVMDGMLSFSGWLEHNCGLTTVNIDTGGDFYCGIICKATAADEVVNCLSDVGIRSELLSVAKRRLEEDKASRILDSKYRETIPEEIAHCLTTRFGFERSTYRDGVYQKIVDSQHALVINDPGWKSSGRRNNLGHVTVTMGIARRDINELWRDVLNEHWVDVWRENFHMSNTLFAEDFLASTLKPHSHNEVEVIQFFDEWIPKLEATANLPFLKGVIETMRTHKHGFKRSTAKTPRMLDTMLDGRWDQAAHEEFLAERIRSLTEFEPDHPYRQKSERQVPLIEAWLREHPNGIERQLTE